MLPKVEFCDQIVERENTFVVESTFEREHSSWVARQWVRDV